MCEQFGMSDPLRVSELVRKAGISKSYASEVLSGARQPARSLAIHIFRQTGWRHGSITDLTDAQMKVLEQVEPWAPRAPAQAEAA